VITARLQLFTENTITVILPLLERKIMKNFIRTAKLWAVVFASNLCGTLLVAADTPRKLGRCNYLYWHGWPW